MTSEDPASAGTPPAASSAGRLALRFLVVAFAVTASAALILREHWRAQPETQAEEPMDAGEAPGGPTEPGVQPDVQPDQEEVPVVEPIADAGAAESPAQPAEEPDVYLSTSKSLGLVPPSGSTEESTPYLSTSKSLVLEPTTTEKVKDEALENFYLYTSKSAGIELIESEPEPDDVESDTDAPRQNP